MSGSSLMILAIPALNSGWLSRLRIRMRVRSGASGPGEIAEFCDRATCRPARLAFADERRRVPIFAGPGCSWGIVKDRLIVAVCLRIMRRCYQQEKRGS